MTPTIEALLADAISNGRFSTVAKGKAQACLRTLAEHGYRIVGPVEGEIGVVQELQAMANTAADPRCLIELNSFHAEILRAAIAALSASRASEPPADDEAAIEAVARAMAEHDWVGEPVADVWAELEACDQEYYLAHARIARGGTAVRREG